MIKAIKNHILFRFIDNVNAAGQFESQATPAGLILPSSFDESAKNARWGAVVSAGPDCCDELKAEGCYILIDVLKWTPGVMHEGVRLWRTDETHVLCYSLPCDRD